MAFIGNNPTAVPLTGSQIADGTIVNANVATNTLNLTQKVTSTLPVANGGTGAASATAYAVQCGGTTSTGAYQSIASVGTSGQVLTSNGAGALPTFQTTGAAAGQVIQVLSATDSTQRTTTSGSFVTGSNTLSVTITPSATANKILIIASASIGPGANGGGANYTLYRGSTNLGNSTQGFGYTNAQVDGTYLFSIGSMTYLDSPSTTSATTYQVYFQRDGGVSGNAVLNYGGSKGSITCLEIKG